MTASPIRPRRTWLLAGAACLALSACDEPLDLDLRSLGNGFDTTGSVQTLAERPEPDNRGIISWPNYQVAVARRGDTISDIAARLSLDPRTVATFNGLAADDRLRAGQLVALPIRVAEPSPATGAVGTGPIQPPSQVNVTPLDSAPAATPAPQTGQEPIRHRVTAGETAFSIARLYDVPVQALGEWNGLNSDFTIRESQILLIPVADSARPTPAVESPGAGSATPTPPSSTRPLPTEDPAVTAPIATPAATPPSPTLETERTAPPAEGRFLRPVSGDIIRAYAKGRNEGIDIGAPAGTAVRAADAGTVAAVTEDTNGVKILVIRHAADLLTVYTNIDSLSVARGDNVTRGQNVAKVRASSPSFLHFEVRRGLESVDPEEFLR
ncbi:peptidoglycan DD-metalloendopeptidase family protein [Aestuariibius insulae]|uniref:peptidoglycan DD-metalloendopeptidase family protein n=1 Tax=Aestuariibius insulae TaxID=2058287 RepID=UPI00345E20BE